MADNGNFGQRALATDASTWNQIQFAIQQLLMQVQTLTLVQVVSVTNAGGLSPVGRVAVQPLVNQMTGDNVAVPHGVINDVPYVRLQGGANAVIIDPVAGDIGICGFASRDISSVKATRAQANPGSFRAFDFADGLYLGGVLNAVPTQVVRFHAGGIDITSPGVVTITASQINLN